MHLTPEQLHSLLGLSGLLTSSQAATISRMIFEAEDQLEDGFSFDHVKAQAVGHFSDDA